MNTNNILSIIAIVVSVLSSVFSIFYVRKQAKIEQKQLEESTKPKFTDKQDNIYVYHLGGINQSLAKIVDILTQKQPPSQK